MLTFSNVSPLNFSFRRDFSSEISLATGDASTLCTQITSELAKMADFLYSWQPRSQLLIPNNSYVPSPLSQAIGEPVFTYVEEIWDCK